LTFGDVQRHLAQLARFIDEDDDFDLLRACRRRRRSTPLPVFTVR
jgi:hypothetical protein